MRRPRHALQVRRSSHNRLHTFNALRNSFLTLHSAFRAKGWEEISVFDIYDDHPAVYLSPDGPNRQPVDLNELPLLDERGAEIPIFSENGIRIPRRRATGLTNSTRLSIMQNLAKVSSLFVTSRPDADAMALDDEFDDDFDEAHTVNNADYELNIENARARERRDVRDTKYTLYPHFFSKTIGQWQSTGVIHTMLPHIRTLSSSLTRPDAAGHAVVALGSQCYNTSAHAMRDRSRFHVVQQGMLTGAAAGSWSTTEKGKATGKTLWNKLSYALPHEHVTAQLERDTGMYNSLRFENNLLIDFNHVRDDVRDGYLFYHDFILPYAQLCTRPQIVNALRDTSVLFPYGVSALCPRVLVARCSLRQCFLTLVPLPCRYSLRSTAGLRTRSPPSSQRHGSDTSIPFSAQSLFRAAESTQTITSQSRTTSSSSPAWNVSSTLPTPATPKSSPLASCVRFGPVEASSIKASPSSGLA